MSIWKLLHNHWLERVGHIIIFYRGSWSRFWNLPCTNFARAINTYWFLDFMIHWNIFVIVDASFIGQRGLISSSREIRSSLWNLHWSRKYISSSISLASQNRQTLSSRGIDGRECLPSSILSLWELTLNLVWARWCFLFLMYNMCGSIR